MFQLWYFFRTQPLTCDFASLNRYLLIQPHNSPSQSYGTHCPTLPHAATVP